MGYDRSYDIGSEAWKKKIRRMCAREGTEVPIDKCPAHVRRALKYQTPMVETAWKSAITKGLNKGLWYYKSGRGSDGIPGIVSGI